MTDLKKLLDAATKGPWAYRPDPKYDDWGVVKNADGFVICQVRDPDKMQDETLNQARSSGVDPWEETARLVAMARKNAERVLELEAELEKLRAGQTVTVKPLVWEEPTKLNNYCHIARTIIGDFYVDICGGRHQAWMESLVKPYEVQIGGVVGRLHEAQALADAEFSRRILSLITTEGQQ